MVVAPGSIFVLILFGLWTETDPMNVNSSAMESALSAQQAQRPPHPVFPAMYRCSGALPHARVQQWLNITITP
jgi:hypothetical protein